ncbi:hypothetical protein OSB04_017443 [Centaurea solstitialis]|uniref:SWIM-type domain-containing protein n=1 Tax=Centaurea solstitialis TaxID=347529 RepID=A0AA38TAG0_9ASTR|nr:hypothetical protein OSB04_017443 [Centaurea solstitialis]
MGNNFSNLTDEDAVCVGLLLVLDLVFLGRQKDYTVQNWTLQLVEDINSWNWYPWGSLIWRVTFQQLYNAISKRRYENKEPKKYTLSGFIYAFKEGQKPTILLRPTAKESRQWWWVSSYPFIDPIEMGGGDAGGLHNHVGDLQHGPSGSQAKTGGDYVPSRVQHQPSDGYVPSRVQQEPLWTGYENNVNPSMNLDADIFTVADQSQPRHSIAVPSEYKDYLTDYIKAQLDTRFDDLKTNMGGLFDEKFGQFIEKMPARASFQDDQYMAFEPQRYSLHTHEVFDRGETSSSSKHVVESDPGFLSPPMAEPIGKRESKKSQWLKYPWTLGKKKSSQNWIYRHHLTEPPPWKMLNICSTTTDCPRNEHYDFYQYGSLILSFGQDFLESMILATMKTRYHIQAWGIYLLEQREYNSPCPRWTIMQPSFLESFTPPRKIDFCKYDGNGSIPIYPAWHKIDRVFFAINIVHTHWVLAELNLKSRDLTIYDSGGVMFITQVQNQVRPLVDRIHEYLEVIDYFAALNKKPFKPKIKVKYPKYKVPEQKGMQGDCGPWWCIFVEQRIQGLNVSCSGPTDAYAMAFRHRMASILYSSITQCTPFTLWYKNPIMNNALYEFAADDDVQMFLDLNETPPNNESFDWEAKVKDDVEVAAEILGIPLHDDADEGPSNDYDHHHSNDEEDGIRNEFWVKVKKSDKERYEAICINEGCEWHLMAAVVEKGHAMLQVRRFHDVHTCSRTQIQANNRNATPQVLGHILKEELRDCRRNYRPHDIINDIGQRMNIGISYNQVWRGKMHALNLLRGSPESSFAQLPVYFHNLKKHNPGTVAEIALDPTGRFDMLFLALGCSIRSFREGLRPLLIMDGAHLKGDYVGSMFLAVGMDANNQICPIAMGVGKHLVVNLRLTSKRDKARKWMFWEACKAYKVSDFQATMDLMRHSLPDAAEYLAEVGYPRWARSLFPGLRYSSMTSNSAESINSITRFARYLPITMLVEYYRSTLQDWYFKRGIIAGKEQHPLTLWVQAKIEKRIRKSANWRVYGISEIEFEVHEGYKTEKVHLREQTCTCMQWQISGIPCGHLIAAVRSLNHTDCYQWASSCFTSDAYRRTWGYHVNPLPSPSEYELPPERITVFPPCKEHRNSGRPRDRDRIPSRDEEPIVKRCSRCTQRGHFRNKCPEPMPAPSSLPGSSSRRNRSQSRTAYENENQQEDVFGTYNLGD